MSKQDQVNKILRFLNAVKIRATYEAVGDAVGEPASDMNAHNLNKLLGEKRPEASWVVSSLQPNMPDHYVGQGHPDLTLSKFVIRTGTELKKQMEVWKDKP